MGIVAAGQDPGRFGGFDYVRRLLSFYDGRSGAYDSATVYADALAVLGVVAAGERAPAKAVAYLRDNRCPAGGFSWRAGCVGIADVDTTAAAIGALVAAGVPRTDSVLTEARDFLARSENVDGGFGLDATTPETNANSTALALSALAALSEDPRRAPWLQPDGDDPLDALLALQHSSGGFRFRASDAKPNDYATVQAIPGLARRPYPIRPAARTTARPAGERHAGSAPRAAAHPPPRPASTTSGRPGPSASPPSLAEPPSSPRVLALRARRDPIEAKDVSGLAWAAAALLTGSAGLHGRRLFIRTRSGRRGG
jgi:hypothetical protein